jgi:predicted nucleotidyltransferase
VRRLVAWKKDRDDEAGTNLEREHIIAKLREYERELQASGIMRLSLFGSVARDEASPQSDVDLMAELDRDKKLSLIGFTSKTG